MASSVKPQCHIYLFNYHFHQQAIKPNYGGNFNLHNTKITYIKKRYKNRLIIHTYFKNTMHIEEQVKNVLLKKRRIRKKETKQK